MTFSLVLAVPAHGLLGAATASCSLGVGNAVPSVWPGVGAVVSQAWTNRSLRGQLLARVAAGADPAAAVAGVPELDDGHALRQVGLVDLSGRAAALTGDDCTNWAGSVPLAAPGMAGVACGNLLVGEEVLAAIGRAVAAADPTPPRRPGQLAAILVGALAAGQGAGGDLRGQQSAAVVVGGGPAQDWSPPDLDVDLRVDDHPSPLVELERLLEQLTARTV